MQIYAKSLDISDKVEKFYKGTYEIMSLLYYQGIFLRAPKQICHGLKYYLQKSTVKSFCTSSYHLKVDYPSCALQPLYVSTEAVTQPTGHVSMFTLL